MIMGRALCILPHAASIQGDAGVQAVGPLIIYTVLKSSGALVVRPVSVCRSLQTVMWPRLVQISSIPPGKISENPPAAVQWCISRVLMANDANMFWIKGCCCFSDTKYQIYSSFSLHFSSSALHCSVTAPISSLKYPGSILEQLTLIKPED